MKLYCLVPDKRHSAELKQGDQLTKKVQRCENCCTFFFAIAI